jgi:hypothetical protein
MALHMVQVDHFRKASSSFCLRVSVIFLLP